MKMKKEDIAPVTLLRLLDRGKKEEVLPDDRGQGPGRVMYSLQVHTRRRKIHFRSCNDFFCYCCFFFLRTSPPCPSFSFFFLLFLMLTSPSSSSYFLSRTLTLSLPP